MNYLSQMKKFLKNNYKKIIIVCLIMILLSKKIYENFDLGDTLNSVKAMETKFNNVFTKLGDQEVTINKKLKVKELDTGGINATGDMVSTGKIDSVGKIESQGNIVSKVNMHANRIYIKEKLCIGGTCMYEDHLKKLKDRIR
jgi:hypothetical protein